MNEKKRLIELKKEVKNLWYAMYIISGLMGLLLGALTGTVFYSPIIKFFKSLIKPIGALSEGWLIAIFIVISEAILLSIFFYFGRKSTKKKSKDRNK